MPSPAHTAPNARISSKIVLPFVLSAPLVKSPPSRVCPSAVKRSFRVSISLRTENEQRGQALNQCLVSVLVLLLNHWVTVPSVYYIKLSTDQNQNHRATFKHSSISYPGLYKVAKCLTINNNISYVKAICWHSNMSNNDLY